MRREQQLQGPARAWFLLTLIQCSLQASLMLARPEGHSWGLLHPQQAHLLQPKYRRKCSSLHREYQHLPAMLGSFRIRLLGAQRLL